MTRTHAFVTTTIRRLAVITVALLIAFPAACGGSDDGGTSGGGSCSPTGSYGCFNNVVHLCRFVDGVNFWEPTQDCGASATPSCQCVVLTEQAGLGKCTVGGVGDTSQLCQGGEL